MVAIASLNPQHRTSTVRPSFAVVFHQDSQTEAVVCATRHQIDPDTNTMSIGTVISANQIAKTFSELNLGKVKKVYNCIPENVIFDSDHLLVWYKRRFVGDMWFRVGGKPQRLVVEWPPLLFAVGKIKKSMRVFALPSNSRPTEDTKLYHAPFMNINNVGLLCQGTASLPHEINFNSIKECEATLIDSQFTHVNHAHTFVHKTNNNSHFKYWKSKARNRKQEAVRLSPKEMSLAGITLQEFIQERIDG
jgi:PRTRC genetic system protein B